MFAVIKEVYRGRLEASDIAVALADKAEMDIGLAMTVQTDVFERLLDDIGDLLDEQRQVYVDFHPDEFLPPEPDQEDAEVVLAEEAIGASGELAPTDARLRSRLVELAASHIKDVRDDGETLAILQKSSKADDGLHQRRRQVIEAETGDTGG